MEASVLRSLCFLAPINVKALLSSLRIGEDMGKRRYLIWDDDVEEVFGQAVAIYYEALRYHQVLVNENWFTFTTDDIQIITGLSYKQQLRARKALCAARWIVTSRYALKGGGSEIYFNVTDLARELTKHTVRRRHPFEWKNLRQKFVKGFSYNTQ